MKAKSENLRSIKPKKRTVSRRLPPEERRAQILERAYHFFSEYGLTGQTRHLASACGVSQRLLYRYFPNKASLVEAVYTDRFAKPFDEAWLKELDTGAGNIRTRLIDFYKRYAENVLTRRWLRLALYSALADHPFTAPYTDSIMQRILDTVASVSVRDLNLRKPRDGDALRDAAWMLHGAIVLGGIRHHVYGTSDGDTWSREIETCVDAFLAALPALLDRSGDAGRRTETGISAIGSG